jgi:hypothetical protein
MQAARVAPVPAGWQAAFARLHLAADAPVLVIPVPDSHEPGPMRWQADTVEPGSLMGGWFVGPDGDGQATVEFFGPWDITLASRYLNNLWAGSPTNTSGIPRSLMRTALAYWRPAAIVAVTGPDSPLARVMTKLYGRPTVRVGQVLAWRR